MPQADVESPLLHAPLEPSQHPLGQVRKPHGPAGPASGVGPASMVAAPHEPAPVHTLGLWHITQFCPPAPQRALSVVVMHWVPSQQPEQFAVVQLAPATQAPLVQF